MNIKIGTRASRLALVQTQAVLGLLKQAQPQHTYEIVPISSQGDEDQQTTLSAWSGVGVFVKNLQKALLAGQVDLLVHSCKDLPAQTAAALCLAALPARQVPWDSLIVAKGQTPRSLKTLKKAARVATSSPRRKYQLLAVRPDLELIDIRGNVETRIQKLDAGLADALVMAEAGLLRLAINPPRTLLNSAEHIPAAAQGALGIECRADDVATRKLCLLIDDASTRNAVAAERELLRILHAGCHMPLGIYVSAREAGCLQMQALLPKRPGFAGFYAVLEDTSHLKLAERMAEKLLKEAGRELSKWAAST